MNLNFRAPVVVSYRVSCICTAAVTQLYLYSCCNLAVFVQLLYLYSCCICTAAVS